MTTTGKGTPTKRAPKVSCRRGVPRAKVTSVFKSAEPFRQHDFNTTVGSLMHRVSPQIFVTPDAYADMLAIARNSGIDEIGWLGTVLEIGEQKFLIDGIHMPAQDVNSTACELTEDGLGEYFTQLAQENVDACGRMFFWGHVHPSNSTSPSQQDEEQMKWFVHNDYFIRGIFGRNGRAEFTFFDYRSGLRWNDVSWSMYCPVSKDREQRWVDEIAQKVTNMPEPLYYKGFDDRDYALGVDFPTSTLGRVVDKIQQVGGAIISGRQKI